MAAKKPDAGTASSSTPKKRTAVKCEPSNVSKTTPSRLRGSTASADKSLDAETSSKLTASASKNTSTATQHIDKGTSTVDPRQPQCGTDEPLQADVDSRNKLCDNCRTSNVPCFGGLTCHTCETSFATCTYLDGSFASDMFTSLESPSKAEIAAIIEEWTQQEAAMPTFEVDLEGLDLSTNRSCETQKSHDVASAAPALLQYSTSTCLPEDPFIMDVENPLKSSSGPGHLGISLPGTSLPPSAPPVVYLEGSFCPPSWGPPHFFDANGVPYNIISWAPLPPGPMPGPVLPPWMAFDEPGMAPAPQFTSPSPAQMMPHCEAPAVFSQ